MGMSASQVRMLTITARIHDVENEAQRIQNQKLLLANDSDEVYDTYLAALDKKKIQVRQFDDTAGTSQFIDVTLEALYEHSNDGTLSNAYTLTGVDGSLYLPFQLTTSSMLYFTKFSQAYADYYNIPIAGDYPKESDFTELQWNYVNAMWNYINEQAGTNPEAWSWAGANPDSDHVIDNLFTADGTSVVGEINHDPTAYAKRFAVVHCLGEDAKNDSDWINDIISNGYANFKTLSDEPTNIKIDVNGISKYYDWTNLEPIQPLPMQDVYRPYYTFASTTVATDTQMSEVADDIFLAQAEVQYEADMKKINAKDKRFDNDLARLENQRSAMKEEMESLDTVVSENIERSFKLFS